jgi:hypothetical protein
MISYHLNPPFEPDDKPRIGYGLGPSVYNQRNVSDDNPNPNPNFYPPRESINRYSFNHPNSHPNSSGHPVISYPGYYNGSYPQPPITNSQYQINPPPGYPPRGTIAHMRDELRYQTNRNGGNNYERRK